jgi:poly-gamma-glutamate synthesis protein (capsule biosynthesis protein)
LSSADLAVCHLEIPVTPPGMKPSGFPRYASPPEIAVAMKGAGYDRCSLASNHTFDRGFAGVDATLNAMDAAGLGHSGTARTPQEAVAEVFEVNGVRMAHLSYTYGFGLYRLRPPDTWRANRIDPATIIADATDARTRGAEFVFVSLHWGSTGWSRPNDSQKKIAAQLTASGVVDLIVGHHAHVRQTIEFVNGRWVAYGLGNFVSNHRPETGWPAASEDGAIAFFTVTEQPGGGFVVGRPVVRPTWSQPRTFVTWDVLSHLGDPTFARSDLARMSRSLTRSERLLGDFFPT